MAMLSALDLEKDVYENCSTSSEYHMRIEDILGNLSEGYIRTRRMDSRKQNNFHCRIEC
jgi:hypothetical protein